ncbi:MAG: hypothetical protein HZA63_09210 [Rhodocyclales bacterium]|nr:hypothetical protein [Rhodocyclales bacterium]
MSDTCAQLHQALRALERHRFPFDPKRILSNGLYVLFEKGEISHGGDRIVRVGTHTGEAQLRSRLKQHFITPSKDRSIFRKNIGRALLNRNHDPFIREWEFDLTTRKAKDELGPLVDLKKQAEVERQVSAYIQEQFEFVVIAEGEKSARLDLEAKLVSTVSHCRDCGPSTSWFGLSSPKDKIRESGLWQVNELYGEGLSAADLARIRASVKS